MNASSIPIYLNEKYNFNLYTNPAPGKYNIDNHCHKPNPKLTKNFLLVKILQIGKKIVTLILVSKIIILIRLGKVLIKMTIGGKYQWKPDSNPSVGAYDVNSAIEFTKPSAPSIKIINNQNNFE